MAPRHNDCFGIVLVKGRRANAGACRHGERSWGVAETDGLVFQVSQESCVGVIPPRSAPAAEAPGHSVSPVRHDAAHMAAGFEAISGRVRSNPAHWAAYASPWTDSFVGNLPLDKAVWPRQVAMHPGPTMRVSIFAGQKTSNFASSAGQHTAGKRTRGVLALSGLLCGS